MFAGGGSLKASLARIFSLAKSEQENSDQEIKMGCHSKLDLESCQLGVLHGSQQHEMLNQFQHDTAGQGGFLAGLMAGCNDRSVSSGKHDGLISHIALMPSRPNALSPLAKIAFTMAEILLSLTIIGVVAAITLPSLTGNINERTWNTQRKALYSRLSQAIALMPNVRGYGNISVGKDDNTGLNVYSSENATETFLSAGLSNVFKLNNVCNHNNLKDCGFPEQFIAFGGGKISLDSLKNIQGLNGKYAAPFTTGVGILGGAISTYGAVFETANGDSVLVHYNPNCKDKSLLVSKENGYSISEPLGVACVNFIYDLNGKKGPNTMGKDMGFMTMLYPFDSVLVAPNFHIKRNLDSATHSVAVNTCRNIDNSRLPTREELLSALVNKRLLGYDTVFHGETPLWSATTHEKYSSSAWVLLPETEVMEYHSKTGTAQVHCVYRN